MSKSKMSVSQLANEAGIDVDETLVMLWDAGFSDVSGPNDVFNRGETNRARRALGMATRRELGSKEYWKTSFTLSDEEFASLLSNLGVGSDLELPQLSKKSIRRLQAERKKRTEEGLIQTTDKISEVESTTHTKFVWEEIGVRRRNITYLSVNEVIDIHEALVEDFKSSNDPIDPPGVKKDQLLESAIHRPHTKIGEYLKYPTVEMAVAAFFHSLVHNHPFHNGNKRSALVALLVMLDENGLSLTCHEDELFKLVLQLAQHSLTSGPRGELPDREVLHIATWLKYRTRRIEKGDRALPWRRIRKLLGDRDCQIEATSNNRVVVSRTIQTKGMFGRTKTEQLKCQFDVAGDGRDININMIKRIRSELQLDDENGCDSSAFYDGDSVSAGEFITKYRKMLQRLARL